MNKKLVLGIDFNNILYGSYYSGALINSNGINLNAVKGFFYKIKTYKDLFNPDYIVFANDVSRDKTFRRLLYKPYKAQRKGRDTDMTNQIRYAQQLIALLGYPLINHETYEADDILGMLSRLSESLDMMMVIVSSDRDMYQLVTENTYILSPRNMELIDLGYLQCVYKLNPQQWIELKMLQGDPSDNIPGIRGIGHTTALSLMQRYGSIESIYKHLYSVKPSVRGLLEQGRDSLPLTRELVTIITDYTKIGLTSSSLEPNERYEEEVLRVIRDLELYSLINVMKYSLFIDKGGYQNGTN